MNLLIALVIALVAQPPINARDLSPSQNIMADLNPLILSIRAASECVPPPGSALIGHKWICFAVTYENTSQSSIWIESYGSDRPTYHIETRANGTDQWKPYFLGWCGVGLKKFEILPKTNHRFTVQFDEKYRGSELRVFVYYYANRSGTSVKRAVSSSWVVPDLRRQTSFWPNPRVLPLCAKRRTSNG